mmetsp:Transcript_12621/g.20082  ORF Transcript_12621/g.20082 Transcript_12621/m.20082 type:complete len:502 (-) Transcript_12621:78-1583(-)
MQISAPRIFTTTALATVFCAQAAWADVTADEVWSNWRDSMTGFGYEISATESTEGDVLTVNGLAMSMDIPEEDASVAVDLGTLAFENVGDGTVRVVVPENAPILVKLLDDTETVEIALTMTSSDMDNIVSGTAEAMVYDYAASKLDLIVDRIVVDGETVPDIDIALTFANLAGRSQTTFGDVISSVQKGSIGNVSLIAKGVDPDSGENFDLSVTGAGLEVDGTASVPTGDYGEDVAAFFADGFAIEGSYALQSTTMNVNFMEDGTPGSLGYTSGPAVVGVDMDSEGMAYDGTVTNVALNVASPEFPLPIDVSVGEMGYGFAVPLAASDEQQEFGLTVKMLDLSVSEMLWGMFDPGQVLPRDPANLLVDLSGLATVAIDILTLDDDSPEIPGELNALNINDIQLNLAGAALEGAGSFTFDNTDMESFDGFPRPEGSLDVKIAGINGLMDKLISMGLLPEEQAMGARMMMGMFTQPGDGDDTLVSKIEVNDKGQVLANGQRLK